MAVFRRGKVWWFKFTFSGEQFRESTKQTNKRVAEQIEAARKTGLAKGEVGIRDRAPVPTFAEFVRRDFGRTLRRTSRTSGQRSRTIASNWGT